MEIGYKANFDWDITKRKLVIFLPSFKYSKLTEFSISQIQTKVDPSKWIIIIGNDNVDTDWDYLKYRNVRYFTLLSDNTKPRNSCFIRNYAIKRSLADVHLQKDAEVVVLGDFIQKAINAQEPWRPGKVYSLDEEQTELYLKTAHLESTVEKYPIEFPSHMIIDKGVNSDLFYNIKNVVLDADGTVNPSTYFQYAFGVKTEILQNLRGYDEEYTSYGWEDTDLFCRLHVMQKYIIPDYSCVAIHLYHPRGFEHEIDTVAVMKNIFITKNMKELQRNPVKWGQGF